MSVRQAQYKKNEYKKKGGRRLRIQFKRGLKRTGSSDSNCHLPDVSWLILLFMKMGSSLLHTKKGRKGGRISQAFHRGGQSECPARSDAAWARVTRKEAASRWPGRRSAAAYVLTPAAGHTNTIQIQNIEGKRQAEARSSRAALIVTRQ